MNQSPQSPQSPEPQAVDIISTLEHVRKTNAEIMHLARSQCRANINMLGQLIHSIRTSRNLTIRDAAKLAGCSHPFFHAFEKGTRTISTKIAKRFQQRINRSINHV